MIISHRHKFIFIHVNKSAGMSIGNSLLPSLSEGDEEYGYSRKSIRANSKNLEDGRDSLPHKHASANAAKVYLGREKFDSYFKFAAVRNPFDRIVSAYGWWRKDSHNFMPSIKREIMKMSFKEYLFSRYSRRKGIELLSL
jgi:hypothetical protein